MKLIFSPNVLTYAPTARRSTPHCIARPSSLKKNPYIFSVLLNHIIWLNLNLNKWCGATPPSGMVLFANNFPWLRSSQPLTARPLCTSCQNKVDLFDVTLVCNYGKKVLLFQTASPEQSLICFYLKISHICIYFQFFLTQLFHCFYVSEHSVETQSQGQPDLIGQSGSLPTSFEMDKMLEFRNGQHLGVLKWTTCWSCKI